MSGPCFRGTAERSTCNASEALPEPSCDVDEPVPRPSRKAFELCGLSLKSLQPLRIFAVCREEPLPLGFRPIRWGNTREGQPQPPSMSSSKSFPIFEQIVC